MDSMNIMDLGQILALFGLAYKLSSDRAQHAEEMGKIKAQIDHLEKRAGNVDSRLDIIDQKLEKLIASAVRLEAMMNVSNSRYKSLETPLAK